MTRKEEMTAASNSTSVHTETGLPTLHIVYITGEIVFAALTAFGNGPILAAIIKHPRLQTITNCFVASLAAADFLVGILGIPCGLISFFSVNQNCISCVFVNIMIIILTQISVLGLCAVAVERFIAIKYPYTCTESCTANVCVIVIAMIWLAGIAIAVIPVLR